jgi:hypothetical protein
MAVNKESANWRLFGGGGLIVGGVVWLIAAIVGAAAASPAIVWLYILAFLVLGAALLFVAFGQTGSNGAVGNSVFGKVSLVGYALAWILAGLFALLSALGVLASPGTVVSWIIGILIIAGGLLSAFSVYQQGVARGFAKWALFAPAIWGVLYVLVIQGLLPGGVWVDVILAVLFALTGLVYLFNSKKMG